MFWKIKKLIKADLLNIKIIFHQKNKKNSKPKVSKINIKVVVDAHLQLILQINKLKKFLKI